MRRFSYSQLLRPLEKLTFEGCVEQKTPRPNQQIANERDEEYSIMSMSSAALDAFERQIHEK